MKKAVFALCSLLFAGVVSAQTTNSPVSCSYVFGAQGVTNPVPTATNPLVFVMYDTLAGKVTNVNITSPTGTQTVTAGCTIAVTITTPQPADNSPPFVGALSSPGCTHVTFNGNQYCGVPFAPGSSNPINLVTGSWSDVPGPLK